MEAYAVWNNKGGTGKSTVTFHIASRFAEQNPEQNVLVVDLCPQANASMLLLGGGISGEAELLKLCSKANPQSVVGYISDAILHRTVPDLNAYCVQVSSVNNKMPKNLRLLSGDGNLELMAPAINDEASRTPFPGLNDPWKWVHEIFVRMREGLPGKNWTIFFDTNPSFAVYTELAVCGATKLLVPINADDSSRVAVKALFALLHGTNPPHPFFGNYTFAARAKARGMDIPRVHMAIGNRFTQYKGAAAAFAAFSDATAEQLFNEFKANPDRFTDKGLVNPSREQFLNAYVGQLRDFNTAGVVAAHNGQPLSAMKQDYYPVHDNPEVKVNRDQINLGLEAVDSVVKDLAA